MLWWLVFYKIACFGILIMAAFLWPNSYPLFYGSPWFALNNMSLWLYTASWIYLKLMKSVPEEWIQVFLLYLSLAQSQTGELKSAVTKMLKQSPCPLSPHGISLFPSIHSLSPSLLSISLPPSLSFFLSLSKPPCSRWNEPQGDGESDRCPGNGPGLPKPASKSSSPTEKCQVEYKACPALDTPQFEVFDLQIFVYVN